MRQIDDLANVTTELGPVAGAIGAAVMQATCQATGLVQITVHEIGLRICRSGRTVERWMRKLEARGWLERDADQAPDCLQRANIYRWVGTAWERARIREARRRRRELQRQRRLAYNGAKRERRARNLADMIARRVTAGVERGVKAFWIKHYEAMSSLKASVSAPDTNVGALQVGDYSETLRSAERLLGLLNERAGGATGGG